MKTIAVVGTLDTKGEEFAYLVKKLNEAGVGTFVVDLSMMGKPLFLPDIPASEVAEAASSNLDVLRKSENRAESLSIMANGAAKLIKKLCGENKIHGVISMGGGQGGHMASIIMRVLPIGLPKLILSTTANLVGAAKEYEGINDTMVMNSLVDVSGLNPILCMMMQKAAAAIASMANIDAQWSVDGSKIRIGISMWGVTTPCVNFIRKYLEDRGYEVYVFHATGDGGRIMELLTEQGFLQGIADITLPELSIPIAEGEYPLLEERLEGAGKAGIPQIVVPGGVDMVRFGQPFILKDKHKNRKTYMHNSDEMFIRSTPEENVLFAKAIAEKLNSAKGPVCVALPLKGVSAVDREDNDFYDRQADEALFDTLKSSLKDSIPIIEAAHHINDSLFAQVVAENFLDMLEKQYK